MLLERFGVSSLLIFRMNEVILILTAVQESLPFNLIVNNQCVLSCIQRVNQNLS